MRIFDNLPQGSLYLVCAALVSSIALSNCQSWQNNQRAFQDSLPQQVNVQPILNTAQPLSGDSRPFLNQQNSNHLDPAVQTAIGQEKFALDLYDLLSLQTKSLQKGLNLVISPFSVWALLVLIREGADGQTRSQLENVLGLPTDLAYVQEPFKQIQQYLKLNSSTTDISSTQVFIFDEKLILEPDFTNKLRYVYNSELVKVNFENSRQSLDTIERYMRSATRGKIGQILDENDVKGAQMIMISAIIFESVWKTPFNRSFTTEEQFYNEAGEPAGTVSMMFQRGAFAFTALAELDSHLLELPYGNPDLSMIIMLPRKGISIHSVVGKLKSVSLARIFDELRKAEQEFEDDEVEVHLPRFSVTTDLSLQTTMEDLGLTTLFQPAYADLSKITRTPTFLSQLIHKVEVRVNEEGTYASAVTAGVFANKATPPKFYANRPFIYMIVEKRTNTLLFLGQIIDPETFRA